MPRASVVLTTFNAMPYAPETVRSILAQSMADLELIVVDDGSTDGTVEAIAAMGDPRIRLLRIPRCGRIPSLNHGFRAARAPFIANQDADDLAMPGRLEASLAALEAHPDWAMVGAAVVPLIDEAGQPMGERRYPTQPAELRQALAHGVPFFHSSCTYRRSAWEEVGGFDASLPMFEDYDIWVRLAARHPLGNLPEPLALRRRHPAQTFDAGHWTRAGYRVRSRILARYIRRVRPAPTAILRWAAYRVMDERIRLAWLRLTRADPVEVAYWERVAALRRAAKR